MTLIEWEEAVRGLDFARLTLDEMQRLHQRCPTPLDSGAAQRLWALIVAMVHTKRGPADRPSDWTLRVLAQGVAKEPVH